MTIIYRADKGAPLTSNELDGNFKDLAERILALETTPLQAESIAKIEVQGDLMTVTGSKGTVFGHFPLPKVIFHPRGSWRSEMSYAVYDLVRVKAKLYICQSPHISTEFQSNKKYWQLLVDWGEIRQGKVLPHAPSISSSPPLKRLSLYEKKTLPKTPEIGELGMLIDDKLGIIVVYSDGNAWLRLSDQQSIH
ncbi:MAG: hypothetical protein IBJ00_02480 [Alphaproteobacteria bacterium]|nr:hypothetical protein [Alphaproteobacteria bacterium]